MSSDMRSPLGDSEDPIPHYFPRGSAAKLPIPASSTPPPPPPPAASRATRDDHAAAAAAAVKAKRSAGGGGEGGSRAVAGIARRDRAAASTRTAAIGVRAAGLVLCLIAFSVMAADKSKGWALDSFDSYTEYRYLVAVNVIGFCYSAFQVVSLVQYTRSGRHLIERPIGHYFDLAADQIMAYLLISASSSAAARTDDWVTNYGKDPFPSMANGATAMSFLAFITFALSSLISAYNLFTWNL